MKRFQGVIQRNRDAIDWKLYIKALAQIIKKRFELKLLGSLAGNKIYRSYVKGLYLNKDNEKQIYDDIIKSLTFIKAFLKQNEITFSEYFNLDRNTVPLSIRHIYAGTISLYFYACFSYQRINDMLSYPQDIFQQYFLMSKQDFFNLYIMNKRVQIMKYEKIMKIIKKIQKNN